jgi:hypothetical protein
MKPRMELRTAAFAVASRVYAGAYVAATVLFAVCGLALLAFAGLEIWHGIDPTTDELALKARFGSVLEGIGLLTIAVASLELSQTVLEEEVQRDALMSAPTRARRFLSRFMLVVVVSLSVEFLIAVFELSHGDAAQLPHAFWIGAGAALLLLGWGAFVYLNKSAEELEPEAMAEAKREDHKVKTS